MLLEAATAVALLFGRPTNVPAVAVWAGFTLLAIVWLSTTLLQVPRHTTLGNGFDTAEHKFLVASNWLRTACWSARGLLVLWMIAQITA